jgi:transposase
MSTQIKTSKHTTKFAKVGKSVALSNFLDDYRKAVDFYVGYVWSNPIPWSDKVFDVNSGQYDLPKFISTTDIQFDTKLSARALKCASGQALGILGSVVRKLQKLEFKRKVAITKGYDTTKIDKKLNEFILTRPSICNNFYANLNSICVEFVTPETTFDGFVVLKSLGKTYNKIILPIKFHRHTNKLKSNNYKQKTTWLVSEKELCSIWEREIPEKKPSGIKVGADQGLVDCLTLSDGQVTKSDIHGHSLQSIIKKLTKKQKGSKSYKKTQTHRTNYINWSINQLNFDNINELGFENVKNVRLGKNTSSLLKGWTYTEIASKIEDKCLNEGVLLTKHGSVYRSQRCNQCGFVHKGNRKSKLFKCRHCSYECDADLNGALNHESDIKELSFDFMRLKLNVTGFFWKLSGCYDLDGEEITVSLNKKTERL